MYSSVCGLFAMFEKNSTLWMASAGFFWPEATWPTVSNQDRWVEALVRG